MAWQEIFQDDTEYDGKITLMADSEGISFRVDDGIQEISAYAKPSIALAVAHAIIAHFNKDQPK